MKINNTELTPEQVLEIVRYYEKSNNKVSKVSKWFVPKEGEFFWYTNEAGEVCFTDFTKNEQRDVDTLPNQRVYRTQEECEEAIKINQARIRIEKAHAEACGDWEPNFYDTKSSIYYDHGIIKFMTHGMTSFESVFRQNYGQLYFPSQEIAEQFAVKHKEDLMLVMGIT